MGRIIKNVESISDSIAQSNVKQTFINLNDVLAKVDSIAGDIQNGKGSLGLLLKDEKLYNDLAYSAADLDLLLYDLRKHPKRYFHFSMFGKKEKAQGDGEVRDTSDYKGFFEGPYVRNVVKYELDSASIKEIRKIILDTTKLETIIDLSDAKRIFRDASVSTIIFISENV